jgi:VWFA-related protein
VILDVVVTDKDDKPVEGLTRGDFSLQEDGQEQSINTFEPSDTTSRGKHSGHDKLPQNILLLDEMNTQFTDFAHARYRIAQVLRANGPRLESPTSLMLMTDRGLVALAGPTQEAQLLLNAIDHHRPGLPERLMRAGFANEMERLLGSLSALHRIAAAEAGSNTRKNLIWISSGLPVLSSESIGNASRNMFLESIRQISVELLNARITVYTVDPQGVFSRGSSLPVSASRSALNGSSAEHPWAAAQSFGQQVQTSTNRGILSVPDLALGRFASETGGKSFQGRNDLDSEIEKCQEDGRHYYSISYYPSNHNFDKKFRTISVKVNQPGLQARTRIGYFAMPEPSATTQDELVGQIEEALGSSVPYTGIHFIATATQDPGQPQSRQIWLQVSRHYLTWKPLPDGKQECTLMAAAASFVDGPVPQQIRNYHFSVIVEDKKASALDNELVSVKFSLPVSPRVSHLRLVVRDEASGSMGTAELSLLKMGASAAKR